MTSTFTTDWQGIALSVAYNPASFGGGDYTVAHLEVRSIALDKAPLPITETGYRSHHLSPAYVEQAASDAAVATFAVVDDASPPAPAEPKRKRRDKGRRVRRQRQASAEITAPRTGPKASSPRGTTRKRKQPPAV